MNNLFKISHLKGVNPVVTLFTVSDVIVTTGLGLFGPIFAVFILEKLSVNHALEIIGIGTSIYLFTRSIGQIPLAMIIDKIPGEMDDFKILITGMALFAIVPIFYLFMTEAWHLYLIQFFFGIASAMVYPTWYAIFTRHIDKGKEGIEWGAYQTMVDMGGAISAPVGAYIAATYGFGSVFIIASIMSFLSIILIWLSRTHLVAEPGPLL